MYNKQQFMPVRKENIIYVKAIHTLQLAHNENECKIQNIALPT